MAISESLKDEKIDGVIALVKTEDGVSDMQKTFYKAEMSRLKSL